jgi:hypothetical protein
VTLVDLLMGSNLVALLSAVAFLSAFIGYALGPGLVRRVRLAVRGGKRS